MNTRVKRTEYATIEVSIVPRGARRTLIACPHGGYYTCFILKRVNGTFTLWLGSNEGDEPCFRVHHAFRTRNEAFFYAEATFLLYEA